MTALRHNALQGRWLRLWLTVSFAVMFTGPFLFHSRVALLNVVDVLFFLPSLTLLTRALVSGDRRLLLDPWLVPLYAFLGWTLLTMSGPRTPTARAPSAPPWKSSSWWAFSAGCTFITATP